MTPLCFPLGYWINYFQGEEVTILEVLQHQLFYELCGEINKLKVEHIKRIVRSRATQ